MICKICKTELSKNQKSTCSRKCRASWISFLHKKNKIIPPSRKGVKIPDEIKSRLSIIGKDPKRLTSLSNPEYQKKLLKMALEKRKIKFDRIGRKSTEREVIKKTNEYKLWRMSVFIRDDFTCRFCGVRGVELQADHIKPFAYFPELRFSIDNGRTLCVECHRKTDTYGNRAIKLCGEKK